MNVNFAQFPIYEGIQKKMRIATDIRLEYADWMYKNVPGIRAHLLAEKIFRSGNDGVELSEEDVSVIRQSASALPGLLADSLNDFFKE